MTWYDMVWHGITWCDMVWQGITWYDMVLHGINWYNIVWHGITWYSIVWHGITSYDMVTRWLRPYRDKGVISPPGVKSPPFCIAFYKGGDISPFSDLTERKIYLRQKTVENCAGCYISLPSHEEGHWKWDLRIHWKRVWKNLKYWNNNSLARGEPILQILEVK